MSDFLSAGFRRAPLKPERPPSAACRLIAAGVAEAELPYAVETLEGFEALKHAVSLLAGLLVLDLVGAERTLRDRSIEAQAREILSEAEATILAARVTPASAHHHHHLRRGLGFARKAAAHVAEAPARLGVDERDAIAAELRAAWGELGHASRLLQGFNMVDFSQSCCWFHARLAAQPAASG